MKNKEYGKVFPLCLLYCTSMLAGKICFAAKKSFCRKSSTSFTRRKLLSFKLSLFNLCLDHTKKVRCVPIYLHKSNFETFFTFFCLGSMWNGPSSTRQRLCALSSFFTRRVLFTGILKGTISREGDCLPVFLKSLSCEKGIVYRYC